MELAKSIWPTHLSVHALKWTANEVEPCPIDFAAIWREVGEYEDSVRRLLDEIVPFMGLRLEKHTVWILQHPYLGPFKDFVEELAEEQPRYHDRPSDFDVELLRRKDNNDFPALTDLQTPVLHDINVANIVVALLSHHIAYTCDLFAKTEYNPSEQVVQSLSEWRVYQVSTMISEPLCRTPLRARTHRARMNIRGVQEFVHQKAKALLDCTSPKLLNWELNNWFLDCLKLIKIAMPSMMACIVGDNQLQAVADPNTAPIENYMPTNTAQLQVPEPLLDALQPYDANALEDVRFETSGPIVDINDIAS
jgi:hypothetical protein